MDPQYARLATAGQCLKGEEQIVDARVGVKLGVESAGKLVTIAHGGNRAVRQCNEGLDAVMNLDDARSSDERCGDRGVFCNPRFVQERDFGMEATELATIGVAPHCDRKRAEMDGGIVFELLG